VRSYVIRRVLQVIPVTFGVTLLVFAMMLLIPGDPARAILGSYATPENIETLERQLALDQPPHVQYVTWLGNVVQGDFGRSYSLNRPVLDEILERFSATMLLAGTALLITVVLGLVAGIVAAVKQHKWQDRAFTIGALVGLSIPSFWLAMILIVVFSLGLGWFPTSGMRPAFGASGPLVVLHHLVLPATALALVAAGVIARLTRSSMLEVLRQDHVRTATAKGISRRSVIMRHGFRNAVVNVVPVIGVQVGFLLGGAVYVETVFGWPGIGRMLVTAISTRDILLVQGGVLLVAVTYVLINLAADLIQAALDPRIRLG
jgi:peptide/nickel transport system permease protein